VLKPLIERGDFAGARTILDEVMGDPELPPDHQRAFQRMLGRTMGGEAELAMAEALSHVKEGRADEALTALVRAQDLVAAIPQAALAGRRRQELERRLWSGYMKVGVHHAETGAHDHALAPLLRALSLANGDGERAGEVRLMLLRTVGAIVDARSTEIGRLIGAGETSLALLQTEKLWSLLRSAADQGLPQDDLTDASHQVLALFDRLHVKRP
jgi:hypothetical protein